MGGQPPKADVVVESDWPPLVLRSGPEMRPPEEKFPQNKL